MPIEIRELVIKVKVEEPMAATSQSIDMNMLKETVANLCKKEVKKQLQKLKER